jgi:hypothetical protein
MYYAKYSLIDLSLVVLEHSAVKETGFIVFICLIAGWLFCLIAIFRIAEHKEQNDDVAYYPLWAKLHPFSLCAISGTLGALSLLFAKGVSIIIRGIYAPSGDSDGVESLKHFQAYMIILSMLVTIFSQTHTLNMALEVRLFSINSIATFF